MMKLAVTGAAGLLGQKLVEQALKAGHEVIPFDLDPTVPVPFGTIIPLDITDAGAVGAVMDECRPDWVVNAAAYTAVDASEEAEARVLAVNVEGVRNLLQSAGEISARVITLSTDYVFDGREGPYRENAAMNPLGVYGRSKADMEQAVHEAGGGHLIARTMVLYGAAPGVRRNFGLWVLQNLRAGEPIRAVTDQMGNPTLASDLARLLIAIAAQDGSGICHVAGADRVSRYDFALALADEFGLDRGLIEPALTSDLGQAAERPLESGFVLDTLETEFGLRSLGLRAGLELFHAEVDAYGDGM